MTEPTHLRLSRSDLWKRHGFLNVAMTLGTPLVGFTAAFALVVGHRFDLTAMVLFALLIGFPLANRQVLRSALAIVSNRPYLTLLEDGLRVDGCLKDSLFLKWTDVEAMSPPSDSLRRCLTAGEFLVITLRLRSVPGGTPRTFSSHQHSLHRNYIEICGYLERPNDQVTDAVVNYFDSRIKRQEPYLLTDEPD